jgi:hypothetical protein
VRSRFRTVLTAAAATGLVAVALIGCQPEASPTDSIGTESFPAETIPGMSEAASPSEGASPSP